MENTLLTRLKIGYRLRFKCKTLPYDVITYTISNIVDNIVTLKTDDALVKGIYKVKVEGRKMHLLDTTPNSQ